MKTKQPINDNSLPKPVTDSQVKHHLYSLFIHKVDEKEQIVPAHTAGQLLLRHTHLQNMATFPETGCSYLYDQKEGHYRPLTETQLRVLVYQTMSNIGLSFFLSHQYLVKVTANLVVFTGDLTVSSQTVISLLLRTECLT